MLNYLSMIYFTFAGSIFLIFIALILGEQTNSHQISAVKSPQFTTNYQIVNGQESSKKDFFF